MADYIYAVSSMRYGTPTGAATMPGTLTALPDTVKGSITVEETEGTLTRFEVDQKKDPIRVIKSAEGEFTLTAQFYDMTFTNLASFKGGSATTGTGGTFTPSVDYTTVDKALEINFVSGHKMEIYNGSCVARMTGGGGRDKMLAWELKITPMVTTNLLGVYKFTAATGV